MKSEPRAFGKPSGSEIGLVSPRSSPRLPCLSDVLRILQAPTPVKSSHDSAHFRAGKQRTEAAHKPCTAIGTVPRRAAEASRPVTSSHILSLQLDFEDRVLCRHFDVGQAVRRSARGVGVKHLRLLALDRDDRRGRAVHLCFRGVPRAFERRIGTGRPVVNIM